MPMSPRLLRPRQTIHPEAADWANRVRTNGGSVSGTTLTAVDRFVKAIHAAGIRDRFFRLNLFCGNSDANLAAVRTPLFRGPSLTGTQFGNTTDTNNNFVAGDYAETGASGGLTGNGSKHLNTGFATNTLAAGNRHLAFYARTWPNSQFREFMGSESDLATGLGDAQQFALGHQTEANRVRFGFGNSTTQRVSSNVISGGAFWIGTSGTTTTARILRNGVFENTATHPAATPGSSSIFIFALNRQWQGATESRFIGASGGYSIGSHLSDAEAAQYHTAMQAFQTALGRQV